MSKSKEKFSRNAAIISQVIIIVWLAVQLWASVFQRPLIAWLTRDNKSEILKVNSWAVIVLCVGGLFIIAANFMICQKKGKNAPLIMSAVTSGLLPIAVRLASMAQMQSLNNSDGVESLQALSVYSNCVVYPLSYLMYVGAVVTIAAAAVYAFGGSETFPRKTAIASHIVIILWTVLQLLSSLFQKSVLKLFGVYEDVTESVGKVNSYGAVVLCFGGLLILAANFLICQKKGKLSPLLIASITTALLPETFSRIAFQQNILAGYEGHDALYVVSYYNSIVSILSYLLYVAAVLAIASAAVYLFSKGENTVPAEKEEVCDFEQDLTGGGFS